MLPMDAKRNSDSYSYPNGMLNSAYLTGVLRKPGDGLCYIQQTRNENHMLPVEFDAKKTPLPRNIQEGDLISTICHVSGRREGDQRIVVLNSILFEQPNVMHMDARYVDDLLSKWEKIAHAAAPDSGEPESVAKLRELHGPRSVQERVDAIDWKVMKMNHNAANTVRLAGFVQAKSLERNRVGPEGKPLLDRLIVLLRQHKDSDRCITVRWYGKNLEPLSKPLTKGLPIEFAGEFRLDVKAAGPIDPETGIAPVSSIPYIQAKDYPALVTPESESIKVRPAWAHELYLRGAGANQQTPAGDPSEGGAAGSVDRQAAFAQAMSQQ
ncbi:TPA: hypothetical protein ACYLN4_001143 [Burkholderia lata]